MFSLSDETELCTCSYTVSVHLQMFLILITCPPSQGGIVRRHRGCFHPLSDKFSTSVGRGNLDFFIIIILLQDPSTHFSSKDFC